jgi:hypothetical protein
MRAISAQRCKHFCALSARFHSAAHRLDERLRVRAGRAARQSRPERAVVLPLDFVLLQRMPSQRQALN